MNQDLTTSALITLLQRLAGQFFLATCVVLAVGMIGIAAARLPDRPHIAQPDVGDLLYAVHDDEQALPSLQSEPTEAALIHAPRPGTRTMLMEVTAYCPCTRCCGPNAQGITASGKRVDYNKGKFVAADTSVLPFGTRVSIPGYHQGEIVEVIDRGGAIKGNKLDLYFDSHEVARHWGRQWVIVTIHDEPTLASAR
jgi:3D (Asp-Asp-Asp) domain-containing protein